MRRTILPAVLMLVFLLCLAQVGRAQSFDIIKVADGVYAGIGRAGVFSNGAFIVNKDDVVVVDTHLRLSWARDLIAEIRKITDKPVRYVVDTHWHPDHVQGNQSYISAFGPTVEYLAQHNTREDIIHKALPSVQESLTQTVPAAIQRVEKALADGKDSQGNSLTVDSRRQLERQLALQKGYLEELKQIQITLPTLTFERSLILHKPDRAIHIYYYGKGHTRGDVVVYLPRRRFSSPATCSPMAFLSCAMPTPHNGLAYWNLSKSSTGITPSRGTARFRRARAAREADCLHEGHGCGDQRRRGQGHESRRRQEVHRPEQACGEFPELPYFRSVPAGLHQRRRAHLGRTHRQDTRLGPRLSGLAALMGPRLAYLGVGE